MPFDNYPHQIHYDEMFDENGNCRPTYELIKKKLSSLSNKKLTQLQHSTEKAQKSMGMTFNVYHDSKGVEKILHLDIVPRIVSGKEWRIIEKGLQQRIKAINLFLDDVYNEQKIFKDKIIPSETVLSSSDYLKQCIGLKPPKGIWSHISGSDIVRDQNGKFYVLEDNLRCPSGVSYLLENREIIKQAFPNLLSSLGVRPVSEYSSMLLNMLQYLSEESNPTVAVLTPGIYNSAYFEHSYLAQQMGATLVTGQDLVVKDKHVFMHTTKGLQPVHAIYRRIDDTFMDPTVFNPNSMLGIPGIFEAYKAGNVVIANAPGTGVADDKAVYTYIPQIIKYYLNEDPIIENVPTYMCSIKEDMDYVLEHIEELVVKETNAAGGYGMLIGPSADKAEHEKFRKLVKANPRNYIAQPTLSLSTVPTLSDKSFAPRHVDLRPYVIYGENIDVLPGALTRVALVKDSLVVNSSQGGGSKDTWVLFE